MTLWNCWIVVRLFLIPMIGGISYKRRQWLIWRYGDTRLPSLRTRGPKCHTSRSEMSHKQGQNVTQSCYKCGQLHTKYSNKHKITNHKIFLEEIFKRISSDQIYQNLLPCMRKGKYSCFVFSSSKQIMDTVLYIIRTPSFNDGLTLIPAWISNHMPSKVWDEITYPSAPLKFGNG